MSNKIPTIFGIIGILGAASAVYYFMVVSDSPNMVNRIWGLVPRGNFEDSC